MSEKRFSGVVFDKDGTLFDFAQSWEGWAKAFLARLAKDRAHAERLGQAVGFDVAAGRFLPDSVVIAAPVWEIVEALQPHLPDLTAREIFDLINEEAANATQTEAVPLKPFLDGLVQAGYRLGVVTNDAEAPARAHLAGSGVTDRFEMILGCDSGHGAKPDPGPLLAFCAKTGLRPEACVMVGDSGHDLRAGRAAGFTTVGVLTGYATVEDLHDLADVIFPDIGHLTAWLAEA